MMAQSVPHQSPDKRRVKVYELKDNDWQDQGTGFCNSVFGQSDANGTREARLIVEAEDQPERKLLDTRICKEDGFQKQQETLIVWTEPDNGLDMALSFQEADGCALIWKFISNATQTTNDMGLPGMDDSNSDDLNMDVSVAAVLPPAELGTLPELEHAMRMMSTSENGRNHLTRAIIADDYISKLIPLVEMAEDLEKLSDLHYLCNIIKTIILLNDTAIIEHAVSDECVLGVVGALEYDPDFPQHKANHRQWLNNQGRHKEVVRIEDDQVRRKIHQTYRLQYLKDVVLARILDDSTFSVLNSLIFFNQVDIVQHLQSNPNFLKDLFAIFEPGKVVEQLKKKEAVTFIQQCCAIAKNLQPPARQTLYHNFLTHGLMNVINHGLLNVDVSVRVGATDILVSMIDHDPVMIRHNIYRQITQNEKPLTDVLIELLLVEVDLGIKSQVSDALKVILDPNPPPLPPLPQMEQAKVNGDGQQQAPPRTRPVPTADPQQDVFIQHFYQTSATKLFRPLLELEGKSELTFEPEKDGVFSYLNEILCFYIRQHQHRSKFFVMQHNVAQRFMQMLTCQQKHLQLVAVRFFRQLIALQDEFYTRHLADMKVLGPVLDVLLKILPRDNLLSSACLELFEFIQKEKIKELTRHLLENYSEKIGALSYMDTFRKLQRLYNDMRGYAANMGSFFIDAEDDVVRPPQQPTKMRMMEHDTMDSAEEEYWNTSDDEDDLKSMEAGQTNGSTPSSKPLVDYASDDDQDEPSDSAMTPPPSADDTPEGTVRSGSPTPSTDSAEFLPRSLRLRDNNAAPPKRRREEEDDDELGKLLQHKRRNSSVERQLSAATAATSITNNGPPLRKKRSSLEASQHVNGGSPVNGGSGEQRQKKISIMLSAAPKGTEGAIQSTEENKDTTVEEEHGAS